MTDQDQFDIELSIEDNNFRKELLHSVYVETFLGCIEEEMEKNGVNKTELAKIMGCSPANISRIFAEDGNLTSKTMVSMADALGLDFVPVFESRDCMPNMTEFDHAARDNKRGEVRQNHQENQRLKSEL